jgi:hypothetical protein
MGVLITIAVIVAMTVVLIVVLIHFQRGLNEPGGREGLGGMGNALGGLDAFFNPGQARATDELKSQENRGTVAPSPAGDDDPIQLLKNPDGSPKAIRIRRTPSP